MDGWYGSSLDSGPEIWATAKTYRRPCKPIVIAQELRMPENQRPVKLLSLVLQLGHALLMRTSG